MTPSDHPQVEIIGAGLAGTEAALCLAHAGVRVRLQEMRPLRMTPAHSSDQCAEMLCSNSLRSDALASAPGVLKRELELLDSPFMQTAARHRVPAGGAFAVDRAQLAADLTRQIQAHPLIELQRAECRQLPLPTAERPFVILAAGPLASEALMEDLEKHFGNERYFYDAIAPIVDGESVDMQIAYWAARYGKGEPDYLNCPMHRAQYETFLDALLSAELSPTRDFETIQHFEGCMPIEAMAARGRDTLRYGPMKPVGLDHPNTGERFYAVVQLRREALGSNAFNLVGFQTRMRQPEQRRVLRLIPGLEQAEFHRYGSMHRNAYINAPKFLDEHFEVRQNPGLFVAGQISGVEGYIESLASAQIVARAILVRLAGQQPRSFPRTSAHGALAAHVSQTPAGDFCPTNVNFGLFPELQFPHKRKERKELYARRALEDLQAWLGSH